MFLGTLVLVLLVIDCGVVVGLLRGGRLDSLRAARVKARPLLVAALVLQLLPWLPWGHGHASRWGIGSVLLVVSLLVLLIVARANARLPGMPLVAVGLLANLLVVSLNGAEYGLYLNIETLDSVSLPRWALRPHGAAASPRHPGWRGANGATSLPRASRPATRRPTASSSGPAGRPARTEQSPG